MGTSTSQRSPRTREWQRVHQLYDDPEAPPEAIIGRIAAALTPDTRLGMAGTAVARCLGALTSASAGLIPEALSVDPSLPPALDLSAALRRFAARDIARSRVASRFGELGLDALSTATLQAAGPAAESPEVARATLARYAQERRLAELAKTFVTEDTAYAFRHFVARDTPAHIGGRRLTTIEDALRLADDIAGTCRNLTTRLNYEGLEDPLQQAVGEGGALGHRLYQSSVQDALDEALRALGGSV